MAALGLRTKEHKDGVRMYDFQGDLGPRGRGSRASRNQIVAGMGYILSLIYEVIQLCPPSSKMKRSTHECE